MNLNHMSIIVQVFA
jgi:hypothetical protein